MTRTSECYLIWQRDFADIIKLMDLKLGRLSWITQVDLTYSHASLKAEKFFPMGGKKDAGKDEAWQTEANGNKRGQIGSKTPSSFS